MATVKLKSTEGIYVEWRIDEETGTIDIASNLSEEDVKTVIPLVWPPWMFEQK